MKKENSSIEINKTILDKIENIYRDDIVSGKWKMGEKINIFELQKKYNISRTPIRDALNRLTQLGIVVVIPRIGYYVRKFNIKEINEIFEFRIILETNALKTSIKTIDETKLNMLMQKEILYKKDLINNNMKSFKQEFLFGENLHTLIIENCKNDIIKKSFYNIYDFILMLWSFIYDALDKDLISDHINNHTNILEALKNKDYIKSKKCLYKHIDKVKDIVIEIIENKR